jgi:hypothetical protein
VQASGSPRLDWDSCAGNARRGRIRGFGRSVGHAILEGVRVTERELAAIPPGNIRAPRGESGALWIAAEQLSAEQGKRGVTDWAAGGVAMTCRWLARAVTESYNGRIRLPTAPITRTSKLAYEELIEAEYLAAETFAARRPPPVLVTDRPGYVEAVRQTLRWAWRANGPCPVLTSAASGN